MVYAGGRSGRARWPIRSSKPVRRRNPSLGRFDSGAAPLAETMTRACHGLRLAAAGADTGRMDSTCLPWRPLGSLLVDQGVLTEQRLEWVIAEQRRTGRLLGVILVESGYVNAATLARVLAEQHGVKLATTGSASDTGVVNRLNGVRGQPSFATTRSDREAWRPLGVLLIEWGLLEQEQLDRALAEQRRRPERRLGETLVELGYLSGPELACALAQQHGVDVPESELDAGLDAEILPSGPEDTTYLVHAVEFDPHYHYRTGSLLYRSTNLLEAAEFAMDYVEEHEPKALEIQRASGGTRETVWTYSEARAAALAATRKRPVEIFGFDPTSPRPGA